MKSKNLMIGVVAFIFAISSAFVSPKLAPQSVWARVLLSPSHPDFICLETTATCNNSGLWACNITMTTSGYGPKIVGGKSMIICAQTTNVEPTNQVAFLRVGGVPYDIQ